MPASTPPADPLQDDPMTDDLVFADEVDAVDTGRLPPWRILIVDDDADVHSTTTFALDNVFMQGRGLAFLREGATRHGLM